MYSRDELSRDFRALGIGPGDVVMVHASVRAVGPLVGGPDQIHLALKDALTSEGTLLMYASCPQYADEVGRGNLTAEEEAEILKKLAPFDHQTARSARANGTLVEFLRTYPGTHVNPHVARFAAWGNHVEFLFSHQPWHYAFGRGSVLDRFLELGGKVLLLGCDHDTVTFLHYAEHVADIPDRRVARFKVPVLQDGARVWKDMEEFNTADEGVHPNWPDRFFARIVDTYILQARLQSGQAGDATCYLLPADALLEFALPVMKAVAENAGAAECLCEIETASERK